MSALEELVAAEDRKIDDRLNCLGLDRCVECGRVIYFEGRHGIGEKYPLCLLCVVRLNALSPVNPRSPENARTPLDVHLL